MLAEWEQQIPTTPQALTDTCASLAPLIQQAQNICLNKSDWLAVDI